MRSVLLAAIVCVMPWLPAAGREPAAPPGGVEVREAIVRESVSAYQAAGRPCACRYNTARDGSMCGAQSAYSRPGGAAPLCYPSDVSDAMVAANLRRRH